MEASKGKCMKNKRIRLTKDIMFDLFDISTLHREVTYEFALNEINAKEWLNTMYDKDLINFSKRFLRDSKTVKNARTRLKRAFDKYL
jgi:hypothetical protein